MFRIVTFVVMMLIIVIMNVNADTYHAVEGGAGAKNGTDLANAWDMADANSNLQPGDTVYLYDNGGNFDTYIDPTNSGTSGNPITYRAATGETPNIANTTYGVNLGNKRYIIVDGITITNSALFWVNQRYKANPVLQDYSEYNTIQNCMMTNAIGVGGWGGVYMHQGSAYNRVINNTMLSETIGDLVFLTHGANHNVIQGNTIRGGDHNVLDIQNASMYNVIRNNTLSSTKHTAMNSYEGSDYTLFEGNIVEDTGGTYVPPGAKGIQMGSDYIIARNNIIYNSIAQADDAWAGLGLVTYTATKKSSNAHIYNNTISGYQYGLHSELEYDFDSTNNNIVNNLFDSSEQDVYWRCLAKWSNSVRYNIFSPGAANFRYKTTSNATLATIESIYPLEWSNNLSVTATFTDAGSGDYSADDGNAPQVDAGSFLTEANGAAAGGSSNQLTVDDAGFFYDGYGIPGETADYIYIVGDGSPANVKVQISSISSNVITLVSAHNWDDNADIYWCPQGTCYSGSSPDIGAHEYNNGDITKPAKPTGLDITK